MWPPTLDQITFDLMCRDSRDYALSHGLVMRNDSEPNDNIVFQMPITLFPSPFPRRLYDCARAIQPHVNTLMQRIATDLEFMRTSLEGVMKVDDFTRKIFEINETVEREGRAQPIIGCISRSDYMLHATKCEYDVDGQVPKCRIGLRQVEVNAIAASLASSSMNIAQMHQYLMRKYQLIDVPQLESRFPANDGSRLVANGLIKAWDLYAKASAIILVVTENRSMNFSDQRIIEQLVHMQRPDIAMTRCRFTDLLDCISLGPNRELLFHKRTEVAVVYYRHCYDPSDYNFDGAWDMRLQLERSRAIKYPSSNFHLSGVKKFQQILNDQMQLERFLDADAALLLSRVFCRLWPLGFDDEGNAAYEMAMKHSKQNLVLKPQREGGGHNIYGEAIKPFLHNIKQHESRNQYILMEYINSPTTNNWLLTYDNSPVLEQGDLMVAELGIYGCVLTNGSSDSAELINETGGYLVRSKRFGVNEGGVVGGYGGLSSLYLVDDELGDATLTDGYFSV
ncbi:Glutathione synthetase, partial [Fragariocoptes setiger]